MTTTVVGLFDRQSEAEQAVQALQDAGFQREAISIVANDGRADNITANSTTADPDATVEAAGSGAVGGTVIGGALGVLVGIGALAIPGIGPVIAAGTIASALGAGALGAGIGAGVGAAAGGMVGALTSSGVSDADAQVYAESVRRGGTLVLVETGDTQAEQAAGILDHFNPVNVDQRNESLRGSGWTGFDADRPVERTVGTTARPNADAAATGTRPNADLARETTRATTSAASSRQTTTAQPSAGRTNQGKITLPVVEEQLRIGKRAVERGTVRINTRTVETPVEEQVRLREERVNVERRPASGSAQVGADAFKEQTYEFVERSEEPVVSKQARVVEEVVVDKDVNERTETVRDTVRRSDVQVDQGGAQLSNDPDYAAYYADFRSYYSGALSKRGGDYNTFAPGFQYGYRSARDARYQGAEWNTIEPTLRRDWERDNGDTWEQFKDSIRYAWDRVTGKRS